MAKDYPTFKLHHSWGIDLTSNQAYEINIANCGTLQLRQCDRDEDARTLQG